MNGEQAWVRGQGSSDIYQPGRRIIRIREGFKKKKKNSLEFSIGGGGSSRFWVRFHTFFFIFKHGLNHPEMQRNFFLPLGDPPPLQLPSTNRFHFFKWSLPPFMENSRTFFPFFFWTLPLNNVSSILILISMHQKLFEDSCMITGKISTSQKLLKGIMQFRWTTNHNHIDQPQNYLSLEETFSA